MAEVKIGAKIRLLRKQNNVTQDQLANHLGVTPQAISRWESETCYPDMESLPAIADFFSVSMDELLCYDSNLKEAKVKDYLRQSDVLVEKEKLKDALALLREAVAEIPSSYELQLELASVLSLINATGKPNKTALAEIVTICLHILDNCTDDDLRDETKKTLCDVYAHQLHNDSLALEIADRLHSFEYCKEIVKATILTGDTAFRQAQENLILFADNIWWHTYNIAVSPDISGQNYSLDEKIDILKRAIAVFDIIFGDEPLYYHDRLANSYRQLAMFYLLKGNNNEALNCVEKMADHAIAFDNRPAEATYPSVLLNSVRHLRYPDGEGSGADEVSKCRKLLAGNFASRVWAPIRQDPRFTAAVARMKQ